MQCGSNATHHLQQITRKATRFSRLQSIRSSSLLTMQSMVKAFARTARVAAEGFGRRRFFTTDARGGGKGSFAITRHGVQRHMPKPKPAIVLLSSNYKGDFWPRIFATLCGCVLSSIAKEIFKPATSDDNK